MISRSSFLLITASILVPIGSAIAFSGSGIQSTLAQANQPSTTLMAQSPPPPPNGEFKPEGKGEPPWIKDLNLSAEQKNRLKAIHEEARKNSEGLRQQLMEADQQMRQLWESNAAPEKLRQQHQQIQKLRQQLDDKRFETRLAEQQVFTPEQRTQLTKLMQQRPERPRPNHPPQ